jgi:uncharacterized membrane protein YfcA
MPIGLPVNLHLAKNSIYLLPMTTLELVILIIIFFITAVIGVITGSNSLITVPVMFQFGIDTRVAIATNMFALTFLSIGGAIPFIKKGLVIEPKRLTILIILTLIGSIVGALLVLVVSSETMPFIVPLFMIAVAIFSIANRNAGTNQTYVPVSPNRVMAGYIATFLLGIYGGFFSGGYVTMLTAMYVGLFGMTFIESVSTTKIVNIFSSFIATVVFMFKGLVNYPLGIVLSIVMFVGALIGARLAIKMNNVWLRRVFLVVVIILAIKTLLFDVSWNKIF